MIKNLFVLGAVTVVANLFFIWYAKSRGNKTNAKNSSNLKDSSGANSEALLNSDERKLLKESAAAELNISVEELEGMSFDQITQLAEKKNLL
jgi:hypothetical protein